MRTRTGRRGRRWRQVLVIVAAASIALLTFAGSASAHNVLVSSDPAADAVLSTSPTTVTLVFDQDVQTAYAEMAITIGSQPPVQFTPAVNGRDVTADLATQDLTIASPSGLTPWKIGYRIVSADGHPVTGLVNFSVGIAAAKPSTSAAGTSSAALSTPATDGAPWFLIGGAVLLLLVVSAVVLLWMRRRRSPGY